MPDLRKMCNLRYGNLRDQNRYLDINSTSRINITAVYPFRNSVTVIGSVYSARSLSFNEIDNVKILEAQGRNM